MSSYSAIITSAEVIIAGGQIFKITASRFVNREFKQIATAGAQYFGATTAAVTEKVWGEYVSVVCQILAKRNTKMSETWTKEFKIYFI